MSIERIFLAARPGGALIEVPRIRVVAGAGIEGDRYFNSKDEPGQNLTLVEAEVIEDFNSKYGTRHELSCTRRNLVTRGVRLDTLVGKEFSAGGVRLRGVELCEPCKGLGTALATDAVSRAAAVRYLAHRAGIRADILTSGTIAVGAKIGIADSRITFRSLQEADLPLLTDWLNRPHVAEWWGGGDAAFSVETTRSKYLPRMDADSPVKAYVAMLADEPVGFIQSYVALDCGDGWWKEERDPGVRGIDQFIGDSGNLGQGLGTAMVNAFVRRLLAEPGVTRIQADPDPANARAIRCYVKAGFRPAGRITTPDGPALLMVIDNRDQMKSSGMERAAATLQPAPDQPQNQKVN